MSTTTGAPREHSAEGSPQRAHARWCDMPAGLRCSDALRDQTRRPPEYNAGLAEALRIAQAERAQLVDAQRALEAQRARLVRARRTVGAVHVWLLALRRDLMERRSRLTAEQRRLMKAVDEVSSADARAAAACDTLDTRLAAADRALDAVRAPLAEMRWAEAAARASRAGPAREPSSGETSVPEVKRALEARRAGLTEALERERARWAEMLTVLQEKARSLAP